MKQLTVPLCLTLLVLLGSAGESFALPACPNSGVFHNCFGTWTFDSGDKYVGEFRDGKRHGQGTYTYSNGDKYVGEHRDDKKHGQGTHTYAGGYKYVGEFRDDEYHGQGTLTSADGDKYVGEFRDDKVHGQGTVTSADGDKYVGEFRDGKRHGQGTYTLVDGSKYVGEHRDDKQHGQGTYTWANGEKYVGEWTDDKFHGQGTETYGNGNKYVGAWRDGKKHGQGTYYHLADDQWKGDKYVGEFRDGNFHGDGTFTYADGHRYDGEWRLGRKHGYGTFHFGNGEKFVGIYKNNTRWSGVRYSQDGALAGRYSNGSFKRVSNTSQTTTSTSTQSTSSSSSLPKCPGSYNKHTWTKCFGTRTYGNGGKYVGAWKDGKKHGQGTHTFETTSQWAGDKFVGEYQNGLRWNGAFYGRDVHPIGSYSGGLYTHGTSSSQTTTSTSTQSTSSSSSLPKCPGSYNKHTWTKCFGTRTYAFGSKYAGEWGDGKRHGQGTTTVGDGSKYVGEYRNNRRWNGASYSRAGTQTGTYTYGRYTDGTSAAQTTTSTSTQSTSSSSSLPKCPGSYNKHTWTKCFGTRTYGNGGKYVGAWKDGKRHGQATHTFAEGNKYVGEFRDGKLHGQGTYTFANGDKYVGEHRDGKRTGQSTFYYLADNQWKGDKYAGEFRDGKYHGQGTYYYLADNQWKGDKYAGEFRDDKRNGQGTYTFANGDKYIGGFRDGKYHGQGTYYYLADNQWKGGKYAGEFRDGKRNGQGTYTYVDGGVEEGIWENGNFLYAKKLTPPVTENPDKLFYAASGSGFAVSSSGHVITNNHVIHGCSDVKIHHDGHTTKARIIAHDPHNDLALLKGNFKPSTVLPLSRDNPLLLQEIYVAGFPFGQKISSSIKVTRGIVSSLTGIGNNVSKIQIDAALNIGNSGGPIIDGSGNVVAVAVAKLDLMTAVENWGVVPENTNFGVKSTVVVNLLQSNNVKLRAPNTKTVSKTTLGKSMSDATYYLSCWMTMAQIEKLRTEKVMFSSFD